MEKYTQIGGEKRSVHLKLHKGRFSSFKKLMERINGNVSDFVDGIMTALLDIDKTEHGGEVNIKFAKDKKGDVELMGVYWDRVYNKEDIKEIKKGEDKKKS